MITSQFQKRKIKAVEDRAIKLYRQGFTTRQVGEAVGKSHAWVAVRVKKISTPKAIDKVLQGDKIKKRKR